MKLSKNKNQQLKHIKSGIKQGQTTISKYQLNNCPFQIKDYLEGHMCLPISWLFDTKLVDLHYKVVLISCGEVVISFIC